MTDFEERLSSALRSAGDDAPDAAGLGDRVRRRSRARRRRTALASAGAVAAVVVVAGGIAALGGDHGPTGASVTSDPQTSPGVVSGPPLRVETWRDASVTVPAGWGHGSLSTWCIGGAAAPGTPVVERPGGVVEAIACDPVQGYGVQFLADTTIAFAYTPGQAHRVVGSDSPYPGGAWEGYQQTGNAGVQVVASSREEVQAVLDSFDEVTGVDANGCTPRASDDSDPFPAQGTLRLCRYGGDGWLEQSEVLTGPDSAAAVAALDAAPERGPRRCPPPGETDTVIQVVAGPGAGSGDDRTGAAHLAWCGGGVFGWGGAERDLTADVLYWVLSPGWTGQIPDGITMERLRQ